MERLLHFHPITIAALLIFGLAALKGGSAERAGSALMTVDWLLSEASSALAGQQVVAHVSSLPANVAVFLDFGFSLGLLVLAIRFGRLWLGVALVLQGLMLAMHALSLSPDAPGFVLYAAAKNITTCLLLLSLLTGALSAWTRRVARRRAARDQVRPGALAPA